jgi:hypothetical protein|tara:strand:- start:1995 stop:3950 length:1956 start_codon:yes stop_codon:yes gene_type:complete
MTTKIKLKKSSVSGNTPGTSDLEYGELALNFADGKLFYKNSSNQIKSFVDSALVESLISANSVDSSQVLSLVDSDYIELRKPADATFDVASGSGVYNFTKDGFPSSTSNPTLHLQRGLTYHFVLNASGHPFYINTTNTTGTGSAYNSGVTNNGAATGTIKFTVPMDAPSTLHYNCQYHSSMNGAIYITDSSVTSGIDSAATISLIDSAYVAARAPAAGTDSATVISLIDSAYIQDRQMGVGFALYEYNATNNQTTFEDSDIAGNVLSYSQNNILVHYNGILLSTTEYTATDGSTVVLDDGADSGAIIMIARYAEGGQDSASGSSSQYGGGGGSGGSFSWGGDRGFKFAGSQTIAIDYFDMTSTGNASDFGDLRTGGSTSQLIGTAAASNGTRAVVACGRNNYSGSYSDDNTLEYITCATTGNGTDFGDLSVARYQGAGMGDGTKGYFTGGYVSTGDYKDEIDYVTIATTGNASDFGNMNSYDSYTARGYHATAGDATYGIMAGGSSNNAGAHNYIQYITYASPGNAQDFGDLTRTASRFGGCSDATRSVFSGGSHETGGSGNKDDTIDYVTTQTTGNATDFGDATYGSQSAVSCSNGTYGTHMGGYDGDAGYAEVNKIDYFTIQTTGNASDFGDLVSTNNLNTAAASGNAS